MVTNAQVRKLALALPEAHEESHWGEPSFRIGKRIFAVLYAADRRVVLKLPLDLQEGLAAANPDVYSIRGFAHQGWTHVCLKGVAKPDFEEHLEVAWRGVAPKRAIRAREASRAGAGA